MLASLGTLACPDISQRVLMWYKRWHFETITRYFNQEVIGKASVTLFPLFFLFLFL